MHVLALLLIQLSLVTRLKANEGRTIACINKL